MNILVTGGAGYIGSHVVKELLRQGHEVSVIDRFNAVSDTVMEPGLSWYQGDFADSEFLNEVFGKRSIETVIHLAASIDALESFKKSWEYLENNTLKTAQLAQAMVEHSVTQLVFASSAAVYGAQNKIPIEETADLSPLNPYGQSKLLAEQALRYFADYAGLKVSALRFFNACGSEANSGIHPKNSGTLLEQIINAANAGSEFKINGNKFATPDGTCIRDLVHVQDIVQACISAANHWSARKSGAQADNSNAQANNFEVYNVGAGTGYSIQQVLSAFERVLGKPIRSVIGPQKPGDIPVSVSSIEKISRILGYHPQYSDIETIVKTSLH